VRQAELFSLDSIGLIAGGALCPDLRWSPVSIPATGVGVETDAHPQTVGA